MPHHTAIVLAAGASTRMGADNKLLLPFREGTVLASVVEAACASTADDVIVVTGHQDRQIRDILEAYPVRIAYNPEHEEGLSTSIRRGVLASLRETDAYVLCMGDMPFVTDLTLRRLIEISASTEPPSIVVTTFDGRRSHPVVMHSAYRDELMDLNGDVGVRPIVETHPDAVVEAEVRDPQLLADIDTWESYDAVRAL